MHFNDLIIRLRPQALAGVAGISVLGGVFLLLTFFDHSFRLQPIASERLEWWQDAGNLFYFVVALNIGIVVAALLAALLGYVYGYRRERDQ